TRSSAPASDSLPKHAVSVGGLPKLPLPKSRGARPLDFGCRLWHPIGTPSTLPRNGRDLTPHLSAVPQARSLSSGRCVNGCLIHEPSKECDAYRVDGRHCFACDEALALLGDLRARFGDGVLHR